MVKCLNRISKLTHVLPPIEIYMSLSLLCMPVHLYCVALNYFTLSLLNSCASVFKNRFDTFGKLFLIKEAIALKV